MASANNNQSITSAAEVRIFNAAEDGGHCARFFIGCRATSAVAVLVSIPTLHESGAQLAIPPGSSLEFVQFPMGIADVRVQGDGGTATIDYGVLEKIRSHG